MERALFAHRLDVAAAAARDFARSFVEEMLPDPILFRVRLNQSYDGHPRVGDEQVFPDDSSPGRAEALRLCRAAEVVETLWRDGKVPEWINATAIGETGTATLVELVCCGRFTAQED